MSWTTVGDAKTKKKRKPRAQKQAAVNARKELAQRVIDYLEECTVKQTPEDIADAVDSPIEAIWDALDFDLRGKVSKTGKNKWAIKQDPA